MINFSELESIFATHGLDQDSSYENVSEVFSKLNYSDIDKGEILNTLKSQGWFPGINIPKVTSSVVLIPENSAIKASVEATSISVAKKPTESLSAPAHILEKLPTDHTQFVPFEPSLEKTPWPISPAKEFAPAPTPIPMINPVANSQNHLNMILIVVGVLIVLALGGGVVFAYIQKIGPFEGFVTNTIDDIQEQFSTSTNTALTAVSEASTSTDQLFDTTTSQPTILINDSTSTVRNNIKTISTGSDNTDLWTIFDKVTLALKNKDVDSYNMYSFKQVTMDEKAQFIQYVPVLLEVSTKVNKTEYVNKWQDDKQAIYSTAPQKTNTGFGQMLIMFVKKDGAWKVLSITDKVLVGTGVDFDKDGLSDGEETCTDNHAPWCVKTDPKKRDTNGDGWWDGIESAMK